MKPCQKPCCQPHRRPAPVQQVQESAPQPPQTTAPPEPPIRCYSHPIRVSPQADQLDIRELLTTLLESARRQSALLEELLRRTGDM